jgi:hypothetical protein
LKTEEEKKYNENGRSVVSDIKFIKERENLTALNGTMQCPIVHLVKIEWGQRRELQSEEDEVMEGEMLLSTQQRTVVEHSAELCVSHWEGSIWTKF